MRTIALFVGIAAVGLPLLPAADHFLTIGGGYLPASNQVSLEKNILFHERVLAGTGHESSPHTLLFADGNAPGRDVQFEPAESAVPPANRYLAQLFGSEDSLDLEYRDHLLQKVDGASTPANIEQWFREKGAELEAGDRVVIYVAAHGGRATDRKKPHDTRLFLWNETSITVGTLSTLIESLPNDVSVVLIMAQCYAGGFAHVIFPGGDAEKGDLDRPVAGFFATVHDRMAAGCTPDIDEENYDEFSSHFWAALHGQSRTGKKIETADYDKDGRVTLEEAHAHTVLVSDTIDIPLKTSEAFLIERARFGDENHPALHPRSLPYPRLLELARPVDRAVLEGLSRQLDLTGEDRHSQATRSAADIAKRRGEMADEDKEKRRRFQSARDAIRHGLLALWPDLSNVLSPESVRILTENQEEFVAAVEDHPRFEEWKTLRSEREKIDEERFELEKRWVLYQRFLRTAETVILAANLEKSGDEPAMARLESILAVESGTL